MNARVKHEEDKARGEYRLVKLEINMKLTIEPKIKGLTDNKDQNGEEMSEMWYCLNTAYK